ncbi:helix-turn-helix domain-containing protein [Paenibacillus cymbidii]|uniref:helix-turn-helix domain-containing protein n=1 Tax=Paenibacillus cymbidii TaxID=1639034 RepID=UPI0010803676|nr:helix-turn-helix domain-containing protein [Paenibacillus cymbidii]
MVKRQFYVKLIVFTLLVSLPPIVATSLLFYYNAKETMQRELQDANNDYLRQTVNAMEIVSRQIGNSFRLLSFDKALREFETFPRGAYYETLDGVYRDEELPGLYSYISTKKRLYAGLDALKEANEYIYSVYLFDSAKQLLIESNGGQYRPEQFYDPGWQSFGDAMRSVPTFAEPRMARLKDGSVKEVIPIVYLSPAVGNYLIVNLDAEALYRSFVNPLSDGRSGAFFILSESGRMMLYDSANPLNATIGADESMLRQLRSAPAIPVVNTYAGNKMLLTALASDKLGWTFVTATALDDLYSSVVNMRRIALITCMLLAAATGLLVMVTTRSIYHPIPRLLQFIRNKDPLVPGRDADSNDSQEPGEFGLIRGSLEQAYEDRTNLQQRLRDSMPASQEKFVRSLLRGTTIGRAEIEDRLRFFGLDIGLDGLLLMLVAVEEAKLGKPDIEREKIDALRLLDRIEEELPAGRKRIVMELAEGQFVVVLNGSEHDLQEQTAIAERIISQAWHQFGIRCSVGIGEYAGDMYGLKRAFEQAQEALRYRSVTGTGDVIYIDDVRLEGTPLLSYPKEKETALLGYVIGGEPARARGVFAEMLRDIRAQNGFVPHHHIQHTFVRLLSSFVAAANELRVDLNELMQTDRNLYSVLLQMNDWHAIVSWFERMIDNVALRIGDAFREKYNRHIDQTMRLLEQHYGEQISLAVVADRLGLNPSYLSRIFKENTGETFSDYLTRLRMEKSKRLLLDSNDKIKEISQQVGYYKTSYFIKLFKTYCGVSPGEFRKQNGIDAPQEE